MGVARNAGGDIVCPFCLFSTSRCPTCEMLESYKWAKTPKEGTTKTQALSLRHPPVCTTCRKVYKNCWRKRGKPAWCNLREKAAQDHYPDWFRPGQLPENERSMFNAREK